LAQRDIVAAANVDTFAGLGDRTGEGTGCNEGCWLWRL